MIRQHIQTGITKAIDLYQLQSYCLQNPVFCTIFPLKSLKQIQTNLSSNKELSYQNKLELAVWDSKNQLQTYVVQKSFFNTSLENNEEKIFKKGDMKSHKFKIKRAYSFQDYLLILDQDNILTVRKQWQIKQCFNDIQDIVSYQDLSLEFAEDENQVQINRKGFIQLQSQIDSKIFILHRKKQKFSPNKTQKTKYQTFHSQLIVLGIREIKKSNNKGQKCEEISYQSVNLGNQEKMKLSQNGRWAITQNSIFLIQVKFSVSNNTLKKQESSLKLQLTSIDYHYLQEKPYGPISDLIQIRKINQTQFNIIFLNSSFEICTCNFEYLNQEKIKSIKFFIQGERVPSNQPTNFILSSSSKQLPNMIFLLSDKSLRIYSLDTLKFVSQISLQTITRQKNSKNSKIVHKNNWVIWLFDPLETSLTRLNLQTIVKEHLVRPLKQSFSPLSQEASKSHVNTSKLLNLRLRILKLLQSFLEGNQNYHRIHPEGQISSSRYQSNKDKIASLDFSSCLRLLAKQQNISILNDGASYLINFMVNRFERCGYLQGLVWKNLTIDSFEQSLVKMLNRLILSKYQSHIENGLELLLKVYNFFSQKSFNKSLYKKIGQSPRIQKLLQQQKKQKLWELAYMLALKVQVAIN